MEIKEAEKPDTDTIQKLNKQLSEKEAEEFDQTINTDYTLTEEAENWYRQRIEKENGFVKIVEDSGETVGYIIGSIQDAEGFRDTEKLAEIESMYLKPEHRGQGTGTELVEQFRNWATEKDAERLRAEASAGNKAGINFYKQQGLEEYSVTLEEDL